MGLEVASRCSRRAASFALVSEIGSGPDGSSLTVYYQRSLGSGTEKRCDSFPEVLATIAVSSTSFILKYFKYKNPNLQIGECGEKSTFGGRDMKVNRKLHWDRDGAVEGLPLQLIIMVAIAAIVVVIILGWLAPWQNKVDLDMLTVDPQSIDDEVAVTLTVTAWDTKGNHLEGVVIEATGCNIGTQVATTDGNGQVTFTVTPDIPNGQTNNIDIKGTYTGTIQVEKTAFVVVS